MLESTGACGLDTHYPFSSKDAGDSAGFGHRTPGAGKAEDRGKQTGLSFTYVKDRPAVLRAAYLVSRCHTYGSGYAASNPFLAK